MGQVKRWTGAVSVLASGMAITLALAGCGGAGKRPFFVGDDLGTRADLTVNFGPGPDLRMGGGGDLPFDNAPDLSLPQGNGMGKTGDPCAANSDCSPSVAGNNTKPQCLTMAGMPAVPWPNGYCTSPCRPAKSDPATGLNPDCPTDSGTCKLVTQSAGICVKLCMDATVDCRFNEGYVCENNTPYAASCTAKAKNWCDPKMPMSCPKALDGNSQICISYSPDDSSGQCAELCDVFKQNCPKLMMGINACLANPTTGQATCIPTGNTTEGGMCRYLNECVPGLACHNENGAGVCRTYCRSGTMMDVACPNGQTCSDLSANVKKNLIGICH